MPAPIIKSFSQESGKTEQEVEALWTKAKELASKEGHKEDYAYITGILKNMLKINESSIMSFRDFINEIK